MGEIMNTSTWNSWTRKNARKRYDKERAKAKEELINDIENIDISKMLWCKSDEEYDEDGWIRYYHTKRMNNYRIRLGLWLVQCSSVFLMFPISMLWYLSLLEAGLVVYFVTAYKLSQEARTTANDNREKYESGRGSTYLTVLSTAEKTRSETAYIIGNIMGLCLIGYNIFRLIY